MSSVDAGTPRANAAPVFAALGDPTRLFLLTKLSDGQSRSIASLSGDTRLTRQAVTKHLRVLERAGLVSSARIGRESRFAYEQRPVDEAKTYLEAVSVRWDEALSRLRSLVEG
jgi:DNA-binding transcriptional ArsR family regulator